MHPPPEAALSFLRGHFECVNNGQRELARQQMFKPKGGPERALSLYLDGMESIAPVYLTEASLIAVKEKENGHGRFVHYNFSVVVETARGRKSGVIPIWWSPLKGEFQVAARLWTWIEG